GGDSYCAQSSQTLHLGLGDATQIDALAIYWADGRTERYENLGAGTVHTIVEGSGLVTTTAETAPEAMTLGLAMFPNPARGGVNASLRIDEPGAVRLEVYDLLGRRVLTPVTQRLPAGTHDLRVDVSALPAGLYIARAVTPNAEHTIRFAVAE
ncbi:MAG: ASPIC/UnbV domain-containing protein, partial [Bacteroidota bacterium]